MSRTIVVGDIHGCYEEFLQLLEKIKVDFSKDKVILTGDLVHKGPYSAEVLDFVIDHQFQMVLGNHDTFFLCTLLGQNEPYEEYENIMKRSKTPRQKIIEWLQSVPCFFKEGSLLVVHAGLDPKGEWLSRINAEGLLNIRYWDSKNNEAIYATGRKEMSLDWKPWYECLEPFVTENQTICYGHWAKKVVQFHQDGRVIGLDTGCCYGGALSAYILEERVVEQVASLQKKQFDY